MFNTLKMTPVQQQAMMRDVVARELAAQKLHTNFAINPRKPNPYISDKPNSIAEDQVYEYEKFEKELGDYLRTPIAKYSHPVTTSMEYGWVQDECLYAEKTDPMFNFHKKKIQL